MQRYKSECNYQNCYADAGHHQPNRYNAEERALKSLKQRGRKHVKRYREYKPDKGNACPTSYHG